jgi:uncharacterized protein (DUF1810 family)
MVMDDATKNDVNRFILAQNNDGSYDAAITELKSGKKTSHWMWWIFPQLRSLGSSERAIYYGVADADEARAYLANETLAERLQTATAIVLALPENDPVVVFGDVDAQKLQASWTLFATVADDKTAFETGLMKYFNGQKHAATLAELS